MSRDSQFRLAFAGFMNHLSQQLKDILVHSIIEGEFQLDPASHWSIVRSEENRPNKASQQYQLTVPRDVVIGHEDRRPAPENGGEWPSPGTPILSRQYVPTPNCFAEALDQHFRDYYYMADDETAISYVNVSSMVAPQEFGATLIAMIDVVYFKKHRPYPLPLTELQLANREISQLMHVQFYQEKKIRVLKRDATKYKRMAERAQFKMQSIFRRLFTDVKREESCPVCYNDLDTEKMYVPICSHFICSPCAQRCNEKCPICRDEYIGLDIMEEVVEHVEGDIAEE
jgi:rubrerythrin